MSSRTHESIDDRPAVEPFPSWPVLDEEMVDAVSTVLRSGRINYWTGNEGRQFEAEYAAHVGVDYAIAAANGTVTLDMALHALHIGAEDEVIVTPRSSIASASCVLLRGATPVFADVDRDSQNLTAETIAPVLTGRTKAIILVHLAGWPCEMDGILALAEYHPPTGRIEALNNNWETLVRRGRGYRDHQYLLAKLRFITANSVRNANDVKRFIALGLPAPAAVRAAA